MTEKRSLPLWREEVSVESAQETWTARRQFTRFLVLTSLGMLTGNLWILWRARTSSDAGHLPPQRVASASALAPGDAMVFSYPEDGADCLLVRTRAGNLVAYPQQCTHLSCAVIPQPENNRLYCPCHEGAFDLQSGRPIAGPPNRPLTRVILDVRGNDIYASGIELRTV